MRYDGAAKKLRRPEKSGLPPESVKPCGAICRDLLKPTVPDVFSRRRVELDYLEWKAHDLASQISSAGKRLK